jgi:hypothetical protein
LVHLPRSRGDGIMDLLFCSPGGIADPIA